MFGKNHADAPTWLKGHPEVSSGEKVIVHSIFYTIQGEGPHAGEPAVFVRLTGCNLRCYFCDTDFEKGDALSIEAVVAAVMASADPQVCKLVVLTGGEPLRQQIIPLCRALTAKGYMTQIET